LKLKKARCFLVSRAILIQEPVPSLLIMGSINYKVPGRICLFGDKVDLLGIPVIAATINRFFSFEMSSRDDGVIHFIPKDYPVEEESFSIADIDKVYDCNQDVHLKFWHASLKSLASFVESNQITGFDASVGTVDLPIGAGLSTSAAVSVGFIMGLNELFELHLSKAEIAEHAYDAEHNILGIMCGRMDQYSIAYGGVTFILTGDEPGVELLDVEQLPLVVGDSCEPREAKSVLNRVKSELENQNPIYLDAFEKMHQVVLEGKENLVNGPNLERLGQLMTVQQEQENVIEAATDKLNLLCQVSIENGAHGAKQMGAGGGGCMVAICPDAETQEKVAKAIDDAGGKSLIIDIFKYSEKLSGN
jgi:mevalonate kinase